MANRIVLSDDGLENIEKSILKDVFGVSDVDELLDEEDSEEFDDEVQEILDTVPELIPVE